MKKNVIALLLLPFLFITTDVFAKGIFGSRLCKNYPEKYECYKVQKGDSWTKLFEDETQQDIVKRVNRLANRLRPGMVIAIPHNLATADAMEFSPFSHQISPTGEPMVIISIQNMAWGAYDAQGQLVKWGPAITAKGYCPDIHRKCNTAVGKFRVYSERGKGCVSTKYPVGKGGAPMPYCMYFHGGFAMHGSYDIPGYNASHGCVRLLVDDAEWLNHEFVEIGTTVIVKRD